MQTFSKPDLFLLLLALTLCPVSALYGTRFKRSPPRSRQKFTWRKPTTDSWTKPTSVNSRAKPNTQISWTETRPTKDPRFGATQDSTSRTTMRPRTGPTPDPRFRPIQDPRTGNNPVFRRGRPRAQQTNAIRNPWTRTRTTRDRWARTRTRTPKDPWTRTAKDPWTRTTRDPWTRTTKDSWKRITKDPWTRTTRDPWKRTRTPTDPWTKTTKDRNTGAGRNQRSRTIDPWTTNTKGPWSRNTPRSRIGSARDPWTRTGSARDPWTRTAQSSPVRRLVDRKNAKAHRLRFPDRSHFPSYASRPFTDPRTARGLGFPWEQVSHSLDIIHTINVLSNMPTQTTDGRKGTLGKRCDDGALGDCSAMTGGMTSPDSAYRLVYTNLPPGQQSQEKLRALRFNFLNLFHQFTVDPGVILDSATCPDTDVRRDLQQGGGDAVSDVTKTQKAECVVGEWSAWSLPLGFGVTERKRSIVREGRCCPTRDQLVQRDQAPDLSQSNKAFEDPITVAQNFNNDFLNRQPRDLVLILDISSDIHVEDFEAMKEAILAMMDLVCGWGPKKNRLAVLHFSGSPVLLHDFSDPQLPEAVKAKITHMRADSCKTCTCSSLFKEARDAVFRTDRSARPVLPTDILIVTDGHVSCGPSLVRAERLLNTRSRSVSVLAIGLAGRRAARTQVTSLATAGDPHRIFSLARYVHVKEMMSHIQFLQSGQACAPIVSPGQNKG